MEQLKNHKSLSLMKLLIHKPLLIFTLLLSMVFYFANGQVTKKVLSELVQQSATTFNQSAEDVSDFKISSKHTSSTSRITHYYLQQQYNGIPIHNAVMSIHLTKNDELIKVNNEFKNGIASKVNTTDPVLSVASVFESVASKLKYNAAVLPLVLLKEGGAARKVVYDKGSLSRENIPVQLMYQQTENGLLRLCWDLSILEVNSDDWWSMRVDAVTGEILDKINWTLYCFGDHEASCEETHPDKTKKYKKAGIKKQKTPASNNNNAQTNSYTVYAIPTESPLHGPQVVVTNPADPVASPFGWHDTNGAAGGEFTFTRGNNCWATEDADNDDFAGYAPDGTSSLDFNFNINFGQPLTTVNNQNAIITNLFYMNNIMHDVIYHYGFDEASGNFQANNYGNGGSGADWVNADAQDGSGTNNANMSVPADGQRPRMQMFLWYNTTGFVTANSPAVVAGNYNYSPAAFGAATFNVTGNVVVVNDGSAAPTEGCNSLINGGAINGNIAMIDRGVCEFGAKCLEAENNGAIAVIICNNVSPGTITMAAGAVGNSVTIPAVMLSQADCAVIRAQIPGLNVTISSPVNAETDSDIDNGIIAHEYGHGISLRLTGGRNNANCLNNIEQMGEGWSDYYGLMLTIEPGDSRTDLRPIGVYATSQGLGGSGIRSYPYTTNMTINPHTYLDISNEFAPHGVGSVWCAMLWEMTWDLIDTYGFDTDIYNGTGGNNIALNLVTEALKLQPCSPGFVDGRDAILAADQAIYNGEYNCLIRKAFARRGLGDNATQGSADSQTDGSQDFNAACTLNACASVDLGIQFDNSPAQTSWTILDSNGNPVASSNGYSGQAANSSVNESTCLPDGCFTLEVYDALGNGQCPFQSSAVGVSTFVTPGTLISPGSIVGTLSLTATPGICGNYTLTDPSGNTLVSGGGSFGSVESNGFCLSGGVAVPRIADSNENEIEKIIKSGFSISPNVAQYEIDVFYKADSDTQISLIDVNGKVIQKHFKEAKDLKHIKLDVSGLSPGLNFVQLITKEEVFTKKFIKE